MKSFEEWLVVLGPGRAAEVRERAGLQQRPLEECASVEEALLALIRHAAALLPKRQRYPGPKGGALGQQPQVQAQGLQAEGDGDGPSCCKENAPPATAATATSDVAAAHKVAAAREAAEQAAAAEAQLLQGGGVVLPPAAARALESKDSVSRLVVRAHKYAAAIAERQALAQRVGRGTPEEPFAVPPASTRCTLPNWSPQADSRQLLLAVHVAGLAVNKAQQVREVEAILLDPRWGFCSRWRKQDAAPQPLQEQLGGLAAAAGGGDGAGAAAGTEGRGEGGGVGPEPAAQAAVGVMPPAPHEGPSSSSRGLMEFGDKMWSKLVAGVHNHLRSMLEALVHPLPDPPAAAPKPPRQHAAPLGAAAAAGGMSRHGSNAVPEPGVQQQQLQAAKAGVGPEVSDPITCSTAGGEAAAGGSRPSGAVHKPAGPAAPGERMRAPGAHTTRFCSLPHATGQPFRPLPLCELWARLPSAQLPGLPGTYVPQAETLAPCSCSLPPSLLQPTRR